jgi:hypothetical protein
MSPEEVIAFVGDGWRRAVKMSRLRYWPALLVLVLGSAHASMRCNGALIDEGDLIPEVLRKCGPPAERQVVSPALDQSGRVIHGAVTVENWIYGPDNGMYRQLRFIDGKLVEIRSKK